LGGITLSFRDLGSLLPITITVASAIVLFIIKEVLDFIKIRRSDGRKKVAIRTLIAKECEINYDITRAIEDILRHINVWISSSEISVKVENLVDGRKNLIISVFLLFQKIDIGKFDRDFWYGPVLSEL
jgi:hypothetical protein